MWFIVLMISTILLGSSAATEKCTPPSRQGFPYTINCTVESVEISVIDGLEWQVKHPRVSSFLTLQQCFLETTQCAPQAVISLIPNSANISEFENGTQRSYFTLHDVSTVLDGFHIRCFVAFTSHGICEIEVFDFKSTPTCEEPHLENKGNAEPPDIHVTVKCGISNVYPEPKCEFLGVGNGLTSDNDVMPNLDTPGYHDSNCTVTMPLTDLEPQLYQFQVLMYPNVTNGRDYGKTANSSLDLSLPRPVCEEPSLTDNNNNVKVMCGISSVFIGFSCSFQNKIGETAFVPVIPPSQIHNTLPSCSDGPPISCITQCTLTVSVYELGAGRHRFKVSMDKDGYSTESDSTNSIALEYPQPKLDNCPNGEVKDGYIKQGTTAMCECQRMVKGNPPGRVQWVLPNNTEVGHVVDDTKSILSLTYKPEDQTPQLYFCQGVTVLPQENNPRETFSPKFAYGPTSITEFNVPESYNLCPTSDPILITCNIAKSTVNPEPDVVVKVPGKDDLSPINMPHTPEMYIFHFSFTPLSGQETLVITCQAYNSKFAELSTSAQEEITVQEPPTNAPVMSMDNRRPITNGQVVNVTEGQSVQVQCDVQGGVPAVTKVTITCGSRQSVTEGTQSSLSLTLDKNDNNLVCTCSAEHPTGCYVQSTRFSLNVHFGPEDVTGTVNTPLIKLCPSKRESIDMDCDVPISGVNPKPTVVLESPENVVIHPVNETQVNGNYRFHFSFIPSHGGILQISCVASNLMIPSLKVEDYTVVTVLEPPPSAPSMSVDSLSNIPNGQRVDVTNGHPVQVQCHVQDGFPPVTKVHMTCAGHHYETEGTHFTQSLTLNKRNNYDTCSCSALHSSDCYNLSTNFTFNVQYASGVTNYTVLTNTHHVVVQDGSIYTDNSDSSQLEVDTGTLVTFVCEGEGNPRPDVNIQSQRSNSPIASQLTQSGSYWNKAVASKTMTCRDTAFYVCDTSNGIGVASTETVLVAVKCTPEMTERYNEPPTYPIVNGADVKVRFEILGHPDPIEYSLTKSVTRTKRSTEEEVINPDRYNATFKRTDQLNGEITLIMYGMTDKDKGEYELNVRNGIGDGLRIEFIAGIEEEGDNSKNIGAIVGGVVTALVVAAIIIVVIIFLYKKGKAENTVEEEMYENDKSGFRVPDIKKKQHKSSPAKKPMTDIGPSSYENVDCPTRGTQYEEIDVPADVEDVILNDFHQSQAAKTRYENVDIKPDDGDEAGYVTQSSLDQRQSSSEDQEHAYNSLESNTYDTAGSPYDSLDRRAVAYEHIKPIGASALGRKGPAYENVTLTSTQQE